jgi:hypothetical protein
LKSAIDIMRCMSRSPILLKAGLVSFIFSQLRNEGIHNIVTTSLGVESLREKRWVRLCAYATFQPKHHSAVRMGIVCTPETWVLTVDIPRKMEVCLVCEECDVQKSSPSRSRNSKIHLQYAARLALSPCFNSCIAVVL